MPLQRSIRRSTTPLDDPGWPAILDHDAAAPDTFLHSAENAVNQTRGMTSSALKRGGEGTTVRFAAGTSTLGAVLVAGTERGICAISLGDNPEALLREFKGELKDRFPRATLLPAESNLTALLARVLRFIEQPAGVLGLSLDLQGTAFQRRVWLALRDLPAGATTTYTAVAEAIGAPRAVRAVAGACAANVLAVAIPCHRVIRADGGLSGYRWGVERKRALLAREGAKSFRQGARTFTEAPLFRDT